MAKFILYCFLVLLIFGSCKKYDTEVNKNPIPDVKGTFSANIDGKRVRWTADSAGFTGLSTVIPEPPRSDSSFNNYVNQITSQRNSIEFTRRRIGFVGNSPSQFDFKNYFLVGNYSYAFTANNPNSGFSIYYVEGGAKYSTEGLYFSQSPGGFRIVSMIDGQNSKGEYQVNVVCTFNCLLYDVTSPSSIKQLTQGEFRGSFVYQ